MHKLSVVRPHIKILVGMVLLFTSGLFGGDIDKDVEKHLRKLYENKTVILRNFYSGIKLKYSPEGVLISGGEPGIWTLDGFITINRLKIKKNTIELKGFRNYWSYNQENKKSHYYTSPETTTIEIGISDTHQTASLLNQSIQKIFLQKDEPLQDTVPRFWKAFVTKEFGNGKISIQPSPKKPPTTTAAGITYPKLVSKTNPRYTPIAKQIRTEGIVKLQAIVTKRGDITIKDIIFPLGLGLDESAVETILKWEFSPALYKDKPIKFLIDVEVKYSLH